MNDDNTTSLTKSQPKRLSSKRDDNQMVSTAANGTNKTMSSNATNNSAPKAGNAPNLNNNNNNNNNSAAGGTKVDNGGANGKENSNKKQSSNQHAKEKNKDATATTTITNGYIATSAPLIMSSTMDEYREGCLKLEKTRHSKVYEAEKRLLYLEHSIMMTYTSEITAALDEHLINRRNMTMKALNDNSEKIRKIEELKYGISKDDNLSSLIQSDHHVVQNSQSHSDDNNMESNANNSIDDIHHHIDHNINNNDDIKLQMPQKKHDMALRGRINEIDKYRVDDDILYDNDRSKKTKKGDNKNQKVKVHIELEEGDIFADLDELRGEKRPRDENNIQPNASERKGKKKK